MMKKEILIKKFLLLVFALLFVVQISFMDANAASTGWSLRFTKGAPSSENVASWSKTVTATTTSAYLSVTSFSSNSGSAMVAVKNGGSWVMVTRTADKIATRNVKKGNSITAETKITNTNINGMNYLYSSGKFYY